MLENLQSHETNFKLNVMVYKLRAKDCYKRHWERQAGKQHTDQYPTHDEQWLGEHKQLTQSKKIISENWCKTNPD